MLLGKIQAGRQPQPVSSIRSPVSGAKRCISRRSLGGGAGKRKQSGGEMAGPVDQDKGDVPYLEGMGGRIRIYSKKFSRAAGMSLPLLRALNIIDQSEIVLPGKPQVQRLSV